MVTDQIPWVTVETLAPDVMSVASVGGDRRHFANLRRVLQRVLTRTPAVYDSITTRGVVEVIRAAYRHAEEVNVEVPTAAGRYLLRTRPLVGPTGGVHAVRFWLGPDIVTVPAPRPAVGMVWDLESQMIRQPSAVTRLYGTAAAEHVPAMSVAELFHRASVFDRHGEVLDLLYDPGRGDKLQFDIDVSPICRQAGGHAGRWQVSVRAREKGAWWLVEDVTTDPTPATWPTLERVALREAHRRAESHLAIVQLTHTTISHWLTDPAPWIRWDHLLRPVEVFHRDDRDRLVGAAGRVRSGNTAEVVVRTLTPTGEYLPTRILLYPYPGYSRSQLVIGQFHCNTGKRLERLS